MKITFGRILALGLTLGAMGAALPSALAAGEAEVAVQLNGKPLSFSDAAPQVRDQRTYLPFRAVFEALGAQVSNQDNVVTAVRGERSVTMTIGSDQVKIVDNGQETALTMDVAPYVDTATWRTYVPVRFAAQALECAVGWDQEANTAIIIDPQAVVDAAGGEYTILNAIAQLSEKYNDGVWTTDMTFEAPITVMGISMTASGSANGVCEDGEKLDMTMNCKMDMSAFLDSEDFSDVPAEDMSQLKTQFDALANEGIDMAMRSDLAKGSLYMNMSVPELLRGEIPVDSEAWYELSFREILDEAGLDGINLLSLRSTAGEDAVTYLLKTILPMAELNHVGDWADLVALVQSLADSAFVQDPDTPSLYMLELREEDDTLGCVLVAQVEDGSVVGYSIGLYAGADEDAQPAARMDMTITITAEDALHAEFSMDVETLMTMKMTMDGKYTQGGSTPVTEPPAGAAVLPFERFMED